MKYRIGMHISAISIGLLLLAASALPRIRAAVAPVVMRPIATEQKEDVLAIDVRIRGLDGKPIDKNSVVTIWQRVDTAPEDDSTKWTMTDARDGKRWKRVTSSVSGMRSPTSNGKDRFLTRGNLDPGVYRVTAFVGSRQEAMHGMACSEPIPLDGSHETTTVTISLQAGPAVTFLVLDAETNSPILHPRVGIRLTGPDGVDVERDPLNGNLFPGDDGKFRIEHLAPGTYRLDISTRSYAYGYPDYRLAKPMKIEVRGGELHEFVIKAPPKPIDEKEAKQRWPWAVEGTVVDDRGRPLEDVEIRAACGWGTLRSTLPVLSDRDGRYLLRFGPGMRMKNEETGQWGAGTQAATISAHKAGFTEKNLGRQGGLMMADTLPRDDSRWDPGRIVLPGEPFRLDFTMLPAASIVGTLVDERGDPLAEQRIYLDGDQLPPSCGVEGSATTDDEGHFQFEHVPSGFAWWFELAGGKELDIPRTQPLRLEAGKRYRAALKLAASANAEAMLRIASVRDLHGRDISADVITDDPRARPFVDDAAVDQVRKVLDRAAEVNRYWFRGPTDKVQSFAYTFHRAGCEPRKISYQDYLEAKSWYREWYPKGISYTGAARVLMSLRDRAKFRDVQISEDEISLYFVLKGLPSTVAAGNGIARTWSGFFQARMNEGRIRLDAKRLTPISVEFGDRRELYTDFVEVEQGHYVPRRIQIQSPGMEFDFRFRVLSPNLWFFDRSEAKRESDDDGPVVWTTDVTVNGRPAVPRN